MAETTLRGNPIHTAGDLPAIGSSPSFSITKGDLQNLTSDDLKGSNVVLNIFPSIDTPTCAQSVRTFNESASALDDIVVLCVSEDLPFAQSRFCGAEGLSNVKTASAFRSDFGEAFGVSLAEGRLAGLLARAVVVLDEQGNVTYTQLVPEIAHEPDYDAALKALG